MTTKKKPLKPAKKTAPRRKKAGGAARKSAKPARAKRAPKPKAPAKAKSPARGAPSPALPPSSIEPTSIPRTPVSSITPEQQIVGAVLLGKVINYFSHLGVAILMLEAPVAVGSMIRIKGHTTDLTQKIDSLQISHQAVQSASAGEGIGIKVADKVRVGDAVYKV